jgi:hypothetical protein
MISLIGNVMTNDELRNTEILEEIAPEDMDSKFLLAESTGKTGRDFLQRLQRLWFVSSNRKMPGMQQEATRLVTKLQTATFPVQVQKAIDPEVNPCEDFYEFAVSPKVFMT